MRIEKIMTRQVSCVELDETLARVKMIFERVKFHHLLVVEHGQLYGVLSDRDLFKSLSPALGTASETLKDMASLNKKVHQIMTRKPITLQANNSVYEAIDLFLSKKISCIPIVNQNNAVRGILSWRDILRALALKKKLLLQEKSDG